MGECRKSDHSRPTESSWVLVAAGFSLSDKWTLVSVRLAVELLLLLKLPPKYQTFHKTCAAAAAKEELIAFQPRCPRFGHTQTECSIFSDSSALEKSLFFSVHEVVVTHRDHDSGRSCHSLGIEQWLIECHQGTGIAAAMEQQLVGKRAKCPKGGAAGKGLTQFMLWKGRRKRPVLSFIFLLLPPSTLPSGKHPSLQLNSWDWRVISHKTSKSTSGSSTSPMICLLFQVTDFVPLPPTRQCLGLALCQIVQFSKDERQERKRSLLFSSLCIQGLPAWLPLFFQWGKNRVHCLCFSTGTIQLLFFNVTEHHWWTPTFWAHKRTGES